ncbi:Alpha/Beta hydrolase protein [Multifurca ochricompacta]|uniref:Carboxylic ester hydrolase n=1 Tax=Multifurca ochricompacta TaxID=376703 RepID=A0AAD4MBF2_9AGAM|nr:Alpha/Beta hydrolase protein [Multifurca ochricompacta]
MSSVHLHEELAQTQVRVVVQTRFGPVTGGRSKNGAVVFLELPYALAPERFGNPVSLPSEFRYEGKYYTAESSYAVQPTNDGQAAGGNLEDKVGLGKPTENPLFVNIVAPPSFPERSKFSVKIYIHGGFLQFGSPHGLGSQAQYIAAERSEVWVNIGYRLSVFGFLACDKPRIEGNFGFKDQWMALEWVHDNISAFGGDPENIQITGLSAGAHSVHQLLHHASRLPPGVKAPFTSAVLQSNAILTNPKTPEQLRPQFAALSRALGLDPDATDTLSILRDPAKTSWQSITDLIDSEALGPHGTFRGCMDGAWLSNNPDPMTWQRTGGLARGLLEHGVRNVIIGDLSEEWYLYSIAHPIKQKQDVQKNLERYYPTDIVQNMIELYGSPPDDAEAEEFEKLFGVILSAAQVHLPVRLFHRDLLQEDYPAFRYTIAWTPEQARPNPGFVTHATDRSLWAFRIPELTTAQVEVARTWLNAIDQATQELGLHRPGKRGLKEVLTLKADRQIEWTADESWDDAMKMRKLFPGEL